MKNFKKITSGILLGTLLIGTNVLSVKAATNEEFTANVANKKMA